MPDPAYDNPFIWCPECDDRHAASFDCAAGRRLSRALDAFCAAYGNGCTWREIPKLVCVNDARASQLHAALSAAEHDMAVVAYELHEAQRTPDEAVDLLSRSCEIARRALRAPGNGPSVP